MKPVIVMLEDEQATVACGVRLGAALDSSVLDSAVVFLEGTLGAGKTTFCRGVLRAMGHDGPVKSPTYTLVEPYILATGNLYHFDLYRLGDPEELAFIGIRDYFDEQAICLIEWPERGAGMLPVPDIRIHLDVAGTGRTATLVSVTAKGEVAVRALAAAQNDNSAGATD